MTNNDTKPFLVLIPGMMCDEQLFKHQCEQLTEFANIDVADINQGNSIPDIAENILSNIRATEFLVAGLSMGGIIAMEIARQAGAKMYGMALLNTNYHSDTPEKRTMRQQQIAAVNNGELEQLLQASIIPNYFPNEHTIDEQLESEVLAMALRQGDSVFIQQSQALANRQDYSSVLSDYAGKALVIAGAGDRVCPLSLHIEMAEMMSEAELANIEDCGHLSTLQAPTKVNQVLQQWILSAHR